MSPTASSSRSPQQVRPPVVGSLHLTFEALALPADPGLTLVVYGAVPGSASEDGLRLLASWAATLDSTDAAAVAVAQRTGPHPDHDSAREHDGNHRRGVVVTSRPRTVLVVGATGSIGRLVVDEAIAQGYVARALLRDAGKARLLPAEVQLVVGDVTRPETLPAAVDGIDAVVFAHGSDGAGKIGAETVDYGGVRNILGALGTHLVRIALMTSIGVTNRTGAYNRSTQAHDWKRRSERLVRASGRPYTIVRPGWFDYNAPDQHRLTLLQGDTRHAGDSSDGVIARRQIAQVLVNSLSSDAAEKKTFELVAELGPAPDDLDRLFAALKTDQPGALDGVYDNANMPLADEPHQVRADLDALTTR